MSFDLPSLRAAPVRPAGLSPPAGRVYLGTDINRTTLPGLLERHGMSKTDLAKFLGLSPPLITRLLKGERQLKGPELLKLQELFARLDAGGEDYASASRLAESTTPYATSAQRIPVFGYAAGGILDTEDPRAGLIGFAQAEVLEWIEPPPDRRDVSRLFGVRIIGDSMAPRIANGEVAVAQMNMNPVRGQDCVVEFKDQTAVVKTYQGLLGSTLKLSQYNPARDVSVALADVAAIHAVLWRR